MAKVMKKDIYIWSIVLMLILTNFGTSLAQPDFYNIEVFTIENGLSQSYTNILFIDSKGFIWAGSRDGLNKYNGYEFEIYRNEPSDTNSLIDNYITSVAEDKKGNLWIGTKGGLSMYDRVNDVFINYTYSPQDINSISGNEIYSITVDSLDNIWFKTRNHLDCYQQSSKSFLHYRHYSSVFAVNPSEKSFPVLLDDKGMIFVGTKDGLYVFNISTSSYNKYEFDKTDKQSISNNTIKALYIDKEENVWVGTQNGLNKFDRSKGKFTRYYFGNSNPLSNQINDIFIDTENNFWVATNDGLIYFDQKDGNYQSYSEILGSNLTIKLSRVFSIREDNSKILWLTTPEGLVKLDTKKPKFQILVDPEAKFGENPFTYVNAVSVDKNKNIFLGTGTNGAYYINNKTGQIFQFNNQSPISSSQLKIASNTVLSIIQDRKNQYWLGTTNGVYIYNSRSNRLQEFCKTNNLIPCNIFENKNVYAILEDFYGNIWFGTSRGVHIYDKKYNIIKSVYQIQNGKIITLENVYCIHEDYEKNIWLGCDIGLIKHNIDQNTYYHFDKNNTNSHFRLSGNIVYSIEEDANNVLWLGTSYGLHAFHPDSGILSIYTDRNGLLSNMVNSIKIDNNGDIWLGTNNGIAMLDPQTSEIKNFDYRDGIQGFEFNVGASYKALDGSIYLGGSNGLNYFHPDSITYNNIQPAIEITTIEIIGSKINKIYHVDNRDKIVIPYGKHMVNIQFSALDYTYPEKNQYSYKMTKSNTEDDWININNQNYASFSNLSPGDYEFHVRGSNSDNIWNNDGKKIHIVVKSPLWRTNMAYLLYMIVSILLINFFIRNRTKSLRRANKILKEKELAGIQIAKQKEELSIKNRNITDSINYARRIQQAILPSEKFFKSYLSKSFILYKPKDIVSGDFYWVNKIKEKIVVAAVDCTGHGVPGAFMSIIGFELFRRLSDYVANNEPSKVLSKLNDDFGEIFRDIERITLKDGMDLALCIIDTNKKTMKFGGAFNSLYIIRDNKVLDIKGDRYSVGVDELNLEDPTFTNHTIDIKKGDIFYIFSDGYADQFGGPEGKKYKFRRFRHLLLSIHKLPFETQKQKLEESIEEWRGDHEQVDDILVIGFEAE